MSRVITIQIDRELTMQSTKAEETKIPVYYNLILNSTSRRHGRSTAMALTTLSEKRGDLFTSTDSLCHCVSKDFKMGKGIAVEFKRRFGCVNELMRQQVPVGKVAYLRDGDRYIFYLVTKRRYSMKPTVDDLLSCLQDLRLKCEELKITRLSMPRIGCGLDRLAWPLVKSLIQQSLGTDITVTVYSLN